MHTAYQSLVGLLCGVLGNRPDLFIQDPLSPQLVCAGQQPADSLVPNDPRLGVAELQGASIALGQPVLAFILGLWLQLRIKVSGAAVPVRHRSLRPAALFN